MERFKNILFFAAGQQEDRPALARAAELAQRNRGRLTMLGVLRQMPRDMQQLVLTALPAELQELALTDLRDRLDQLAAPLRQQGRRRRVEARCSSWEFR